MSVQKSRYWVGLFIPDFYFLEYFSQILIYARHVRGLFADRRRKKVDESLLGEFVEYGDEDRHEAVFRWLNPGISTPLFGRCTDSIFHNRVDMERSLTLTAAYEAATRITIFVLLNDKDCLRTARLLKEKNWKIHHRAHTCRNRRFLWKNFFRFLMTSTTPVLIERPFFPEILLSNSAKNNSDRYLLPSKSLDARCIQTLTRLQLSSRGWLYMALKVLVQTINISKEYGRIRITCRLARKIA